MVCTLRVSKASHEVLQSFPMVCDRFGKEKCQHVSGLLLKARFKLRDHQRERDSVDLEESLLVSVIKSKEGVRGFLWKNALSHCSSSILLIIFGFGSWKPLVICLIFKTTIDSRPLLHFILRIPLRPSSSFLRRISDKQVTMPSSTWIQTIP